MKRALQPLLLAGVLTGVAGCRPIATPPRAQAAPTGFRFEDVASDAGIHFRLGHGGKSPLTVLETAGGGCAFLDYNGDALPDALLVGPGRVGLFRNTGDGRFAEVTATSGLPQRPEWMGCATADYDGDGRVDVLLTGYGYTRLYRNTGNGFRDVTESSGLKVPGWALSAAFADYDRDGRLDLYVTRYLRFDQSTPQVCQLGPIKTACGPEMYDAERGLLFRNIGEGRFRDVTEASGLADTHGKGWTALLSDFTGDGYPDLYIANDLTPCDFYVNSRGHFSRSGAAGSLAYDGNGHLLGAMGADSADYDRDGDLDLVVTTFFAQATCLYRNDGNSLFAEVGTKQGVGGPTMRYVGFGTALADFDNDGWRDLFVANGHVRDNIRIHDPGQDYAQPLQLFASRLGQFVEVSASAGDAFDSPVVGRGIAVADYDQDGKQDILVCNLEGDALLLRNTNPGANHWLTVRLKGPRGNTQGIGARVEVEHRGVSTIAEVRSCGSVMSGNDPVAHFGLHAETSVDRLTVLWPDGRTSILEHPEVDRILEIEHP